MSRNQSTGPWWSALDRALVNLRPGRATRSRGQPILQLQLSTRAHNCLRRNGIHTIEDAARFTKDQLLRLRNVGEATADEILHAVRNYQKP